MSTAPAHPKSRGEMRLARFEVVRTRRGTVMERFTPNLAREHREEVRTMVAEMKDDARRWGDQIVVRRAGGAA